MPTVSPTTTALLIALVLGAACSAWLWLVHNRKLVTTLGLRALAAMRWRESSRFVIDALEGQGFTASRLTPDADRGQNADLLLNRGDQTWLLSFKQGVDYKVDPKMVSQMAAAVRDSNASGGIIATLGTIQNDARKHPQNVELTDGATLWPLISPLLPPSLLNGLTARARRSTARATGLAWVAALLLGLGVSFLFPGATGDPQERLAANGTSTIGPSAANPNEVTGPTDATAPATPLSEEEQRGKTAREVAALPGVDRASWATRSTLVAVMKADTNEEHIAAICRVLAPYEELRYSRIQLQPPSGSAAPVRFMQCTGKAAAATPGAIRD